MKRPADLLDGSGAGSAVLAGHCPVRPAGSGTTGAPSALPCSAHRDLPSSASPGLPGQSSYKRHGQARSCPLPHDGPVDPGHGRSPGLGPGQTGGSRQLGDRGRISQGSAGLGASLLAGAAGAGSTTIWAGYTRGAVSRGSSTGPTTWTASAWRRGRPVRRSRPRPSTSMPAAPGQGRPLLRWREPAAQIRFPAGDLPPHGSDGFWSVTLYNAAGFLVANPIDGYSIGDQTPGLVRGADGSLTIVVSASRPSATDVNWLPAPKGAFSLVLRVYDPTPRVLDGSWSPPVIRAVS